MLIVVISIVAVLAFLITLCFIYKDNIKAHFKKKKKSSKKTASEPKPEPKSAVNPDEFIPLKSQPIEDDYMDSALEALLNSNDDTNMPSDMSDIFGSSGNKDEEKPSFENDDFNPFGSVMQDRFKENKTIAEQIKDLSPELKALLLDSTLKKRDDV